MFTATIKSPPFSLVISTGILATSPPSTNKRESIFIGANKKVTLELARKALLNDPLLSTTTFPVIKSVQTALNLNFNRSKDVSEW